MDAQVWRVEQLIGDGQDMPLRRDNDAGAVGGQTLEAAGAEQLDHLVVDVVATFSNGLGRRRLDGERQAK